MNVIDIQSKGAAEKEREQFSERLIHALKSSGYNSSPTKLQREFNARSDRPITVHAARKWLVGESIPTQARIRLLADWLGVDAAQLRYGAVRDMAIADRPQIAPENVRLLSDLAQLSERDRRMIRTLASIMVHEKKERAAA